MEGKNALIKSTLDSLEEMIGSMSDDQVIRFREELGRIRRSIKRRSRSMSVPMPSQTVAAAHRHCSSLGVDMSEWVERTVRKAIAKADGNVGGSHKKKADKGPRKRIKVAVPSQQDEAPKVL